MAFCAWQPADRLLPGVPQPSPGSETGKFQAAGGRAQGWR